ncbi:MarR family winged helix-turn-helix transcriptional regulator [Hyphococcus luteus]|uniref:HTH marR-type domain-containing protein n=1 Tax=Hyphococcus luteus TaxID=2058213 RepID=A0A2S7KAF9_9PROT|nr:MarR family transcriptional regulator [Marinicaulis flavus]PQA89500.1 hypothetical protein CW354_01100 [Marinicaulis flavus]
MAKSKTKRPRADEKRAQEDAPRDRDQFDQWSSHYEDFYARGARLDREFRLSRMLVLAARSWMSRIDNILREETGETRARWQALFALGFAEQPATMSALSKRLRVQWPTLVRVMDGMEKDGLIRREDNPSDGRSKLVYVTAKGRRVMAKIQPILDRERAQVLSRLSDKELESCADMLERIFEDVINS